jgi:hypothetical protein
VRSAFIVLDRGVNSGQKTKSLAFIRKFLTNLKVGVLWLYYGGSWRCCVSGRGAFLCPRSALRKNSVEQQREKLK